MIRLRDARISERVRTIVTWAVLLPAAVVLLLVVGAMVPTAPMMSALVVVVVLALGLTLLEPMAIPLVMMPFVLVISRFSLGPVDLSIADLALAVAFVPALLLGRRPYSPALRSLLWLSFTYQVATLFTVVANPYTANAVEWFHAWILVTGALVVGWSLAVAGSARHALSILLVVSLVIALGTILQGTLQVAGGDFGPVFPEWPFSMHKNYAGTVLAFMAVVAYARPRWMGWSPPAALAAFWVMAGAIAFTQSRQAVVAVAVGVAVIALRRDREQRRSRLILLAVIPAAVLVATLVRDEVAAGDVHSSVFQRLTWFEDTMSVWSSSPLFGAGLRYWVADRTDFAFQPPNAELEVLASAGVVGLAGFLVLLIGSLLVVWRVNPVYGNVALAVLLARTAQGQLDLFWVAVQASLPFLIVGLALGAQARADEDAREVTPLSRAPGRGTVGSLHA